MKWTSSINWLLFDTKIRTFWAQVYVTSRNSRVTAQKSRENSRVTQTLKVTELHKVTL